ncbi:hypothetical protein [Halarchaeum grantii]|uniref:hypothetical protein n=1 Tax=Halarchaeum grantii TaxID=1193105 RepID=UPI00166E6332|nr:hypothetical protein [Halarchaeum grantii]
MTPYEPELIEVALSPEQGDKLEAAVEANDAVGNESELLQLLIAEETATLEQLSPDYDVTAIRSMLERQQELLEQIAEGVEESNSDLDAVSHRLENVRETQEAIRSELESHLIY